MKKPRTKRKTADQKLKGAVKTLYYYGFISQFERDSFLMRFTTMKKNKQKWRLTL